MLVTENKARALLSDYPNNPIILNILSVCLISQNQFDEPEKILTKLIDNYPRYFEPYINLGALLDRQNKKDEALTVFNKCLEFKDIHESSKEILHLNVGNILLDKALYDEAIESYKSSLKINPKNINAHNKIGDAFMFIEDRKNAIKHYEEVLKLDSQKEKETKKNHKKIKGISSFLTRLKWRSHFIQKFESEYQISYRCANKVFEKMRYENNPELIYKWKSGKTGFPLVDANMLCLIETGWINFRMRAMLVSIFSYQFDCNWKLGARYLAELFLDYEPGIHFSQFQMQSGTTGINTIRMYNPIKQSYDHDADGLFIKQWIPELENVPKEYIHEPWKMPPLINTLSQDSIYNNPCVNIAESGKAARSKIWSFKASKEVKKENKRILHLHVRNNNRSAHR